MFMNAFPNNINSDILALNIELERNLKLIFIFIIHIVIIACCYCKSLIFSWKTERLLYVLICWFLHDFYWFVIRFFSSSTKNSRLPKERSSFSFLHFTKATKILTKPLFSVYLNTHTAKKKYIYRWLRVMVTKIDHKT